MLSKNVIHIRNIVVSVACLVIGVFDLLPSLPQWAWIAIGCVGLAVDAAYVAISRRRSRAATSANGEPKS